MKNKFFLGLALLVITGCGPSIRVFSDYDKSLPVSHYKTYNWSDLKPVTREGTNPRYVSALTDERIRKAVNRELTGLGFTSSAVNASMEVHYHIVVADKTMTVTEPFGYRYSPYLEQKMTNTYEYREGTLIIDLFDTQTNELVWRGWATDVITDKAVKEPEKAINYAVKEIFKRSPFATQ